MMTIADDAAPPAAVPVAVQSMPVLPRIFAVAIDIWVLRFVMLFAGPRLESLGLWAAWIGVGIGILYLGIGASRVTSGRTIGKLLTGIAVRRPDGGFLSVPAGLGRATIVMLPLGLAGLLTNGLLAGLVPSPWQIMPALPIAAITFAIPCLFAFNVPTHRSVHDYASGSVVVSVPMAGPVADDAPFEWRRHVVVIAVVLVAPALLIFAHIRLMLRRPAPMRPALTQIATLAHTEDVAVSDGTTVVGDRPARAITASATIYGPGSTPDTLARGMAAAVLRSVPDARSRDAVIVEITTRNDMLFSQDQHTATWRHTPAEWAEIVAHPAMENPPTRRQ